MRSEEYTPENICRCLGLPGFNNDPALMAADRAVRLLLLPSFDPEICITLTEAAGTVTIAIIAARTMIWRKFEPNYVLTHREQFCLEDRLAHPLLDNLQTAAQEHKKGAYLVIDGMPAHGVFFEKAQKKLSFEDNLGMRSNLSHTTGQLITVLWEQTKDASCKNALGCLGKYLGLDLPETKTGAEDKTIVNTLVLGQPEDRAELMQALRHVTKN